MNAKTILQLIGCISALVVISSCGTTNPGSAVTTFKTVTISGSALTPLVPVSVFAGTTCSNDVHAGIATFTDTPLNVSLTSTVYTVSSSTSTVVTGQPVTINGYTVNYYPKDGGPAISPLIGGFTGQVLPGATLSIPVYIANNNMVGLEQNDPLLQKCASNSHTYTVIITFSGTELGGTNGNITVETELTFTNSLT